MRACRYGWSVALVAFAIPLNTWAIGLRTTFGQVYVENLQIGMTYSLDKLIHLPLRIVNESDAEVKLDLSVIAPPNGGLKKGFEPIPNLNWIKLEQDHLTAAPMHEAVTDIVISIPNDPKLLGRKFQVDIWSKTNNKTGMFQTGLDSRLLLFINTVPPSEEELKKKFVNRRLANLDFTLFPSGGVAENVPLGKDFDLMKERHLSIKIVNPNDKTLNFRILSIANWELTLPLPPGVVDAPDPKWVRPAKEIIAISPDKIKETALIANIPDKPENRGKAFFFVISAEILQQEIATHVYYQLVVKTQDKPKGKK
jgi:hypothetical protein